MEQVIRASRCQKVVAGTAMELVVIVVANQAVVEGRPDQALDAGQYIAGGVTTGGRTGPQVHCDPAGAIGIAGGVEAVSAGEGVSAEPPFEHIVAIAAIEGIAVIAANDRVLEVRALDMLDRDEPVAGSLTPGPAGQEVEGHARSRIAIARSITSIPSTEKVTSDTADQDIVAGTARKTVCGPGSEQDVVARPRDDVLHVESLLEGTIGECRLRQREIDGHVARMVGEVQRVDAITAVEAVSAEIAV